MQQLVCLEVRADWLADMYSTYRRHFNVWSELDVAVGMLSLVVKMTTTIEMTVHDGNYGDDDDDNNNYHIRAPQ